MSAVEIEIEPPGLPADEPDDEPDGITVGCTIREPDGTGRAGFAAVGPDADDATLAALMVDVMRGAAAARGPGVAAALDRHLTTPPPPHPGAHP